MHACRDTFFAEAYPPLNNPCNGYDPTPVRMLVWEGA